MARCGATELSSQLIGIRRRRQSVKKTRFEQVMSSPVRYENIGYVLVASIAFDDASNKSNIMKEEVLDPSLKDILGDDSVLQKRGGSTSNTAKVLIALTGGIGIGITVVCASFVAPALRKYCLPYVPATPNQIKNILSLIPKHSEGKLLDIGSGDGRIVFAANKHGLKETHGIELNTWLVLYSKFVALKQSSENKPRFYRGNLWEFNVSPYNYVVCFGVEQMMADLEKKILIEAQQGSKIILCRFPFPNLIPDKTIGCGVDTVWLYCIKEEENR